VSDLDFLRAALEDSAADARLLEDFKTALAQRVAVQIGAALGGPAPAFAEIARDVSNLVLDSMAAGALTDGVALPQYIMARLVRRRSAEIERVTRAVVAHRCAEILAARRC